MGLISQTLNVFPSPGRYGSADCVDLRVDNQTCGFEFLIREKVEHFKCYSTNFGICCMYYNPVGGEKRKIS